jgi:hypothetical protein
VPGSATRGPEYQRHNGRLCATHVVGPRSLRVGGVEPEVLEKAGAGLAAGGVTTPGRNVGGVATSGGQHERIDVGTGLPEAEGPAVAADELGVPEPLHELVQRCS